MEPHGFSALEALAGAPCCCLPGYGYCYFVPILLRAHLSAGAVTTATWHANILNIYVCTPISLLHLYLLLYVYVVENGGVLQRQRFNIA